MPKYMVEMLVTILAPDLENAQDAADSLHVDCLAAQACVDSYEVTSRPRERDA